MYDRRPNFSHPEDSASGRRVDAKVKWFNVAKGFGFVTPSDGTQDAFLPMATLRRAGFEDVGEGASLVCEIGAGAKGPLVLNVLDVDLSTAVAPSGPRGGYDGPCPPNNDLKPHRYLTRVYALDVPTLGLRGVFFGEAALMRMKDHVLAVGEALALYAPANRAR